MSDFDSGEQVAKKLLETFDDPALIGEVEDIDTDVASRARNRLFTYLGHRLDVETRREGLEIALENKLLEQIDMNLLKPDQVISALTRIRRENSIASEPTMGLFKGGEKDGGGTNLLTAQTQADSSGQKVFENISKEEKSKLLDAVNFLIQK